MTLFEQELRELFADGSVIESSRFAGRTCFGTIGKDLRVRVQFVISGHADHYDDIRQAMGEYLDVFRERAIEREHTGPKLIYICAPLRGEVEKNIAFAREKAREVFAEGDIPICPHLMFPPIADPADPTQDQAAWEMGLRLVESCQQLNVYGPIWTDGMWAEIHHAERLGIPVMTDQKELGRSPQKNSKKKEKPAYER